MSKEILICTKVSPSYRCFEKKIVADLSDFLGKPIEPRKVSKDQMLPVKLPSGKFCGVILHDEWPLTHDNEYQRALYDCEV